MRVVLQRVTHAKVTVDGKITGEIDGGLLALVGIGRDDEEADIERLAKKTVHLRIFEDSAGKMNLDIKQAGGSILSVSQFTLYGDVSRGNRPG
ncbi:MAG: D-aminoacyl-tRNA deacylase, partial [Candidatus Omnitrophota bacterium]